jgi:hypothetical protein
MYWDGYGWAAPQAPTATKTKKSSSGGKVALVVVGIFCRPLRTRKMRKQ